MKIILRVLRWVSLFPVSLIGGYLLYRFILYIREPAYDRSGIIGHFFDSSIGLFFINFSNLVIWGAITTLIAICIAPSHKKIVAACITCIFLGLVVVIGAYMFLSYTSPGEPVFLMSGLIGAPIGSLLCTITILKAYK